MSADGADAVVALNNFFVSLGANYLGWRQLHQAFNCSIKVQVY